MLDLLQQADARLQACGSGQDVDFSADITFLPTVKQFCSTPRTLLQATSETIYQYGSSSLVSLATLAKLTQGWTGSSMEILWHSFTLGQKSRQSTLVLGNAFSWLKSVWQKLWGQSMCSHTLIVNILGKCTLPTMCHAGIPMPLFYGKGMNCLHQVRWFLVSVCADPAFSMAWE